MMQEAKRMHWAARAGFGDGVHALSAATSKARAAARPLLDLTVTNPTRCGFEYPTEALKQGLTTAEMLQYEADALGMRSARQSIVDGYYAPRGVPVEVDNLLLTASTSEAYGYLLKLLCDPGDEILVPQPGYPLFDLLAQLHDVTLRPYHLLLHDGWRIDLQDLRESITERTRAIVIVHPNNPTGHAVHAEERAELERIAVECGLALIVDEVFLDFRVEAGLSLRSFARSNAPALTFVLSGLSKVLALPQIKLAWMVLCGPKELVSQAKHRLEFIADTFLSVNGPVQQALGPWLALAPAMHAQIAERVRANLRELDRVLAEHELCHRLPVHAGWCALLRVPATLADEELACRLVQERGIVVHPGSFYGLPAAGWLVLSLIGPESGFREGSTALIKAVEEFDTAEPSPPALCKMGKAGP